VSKDEQETEKDDDAGPMDAAPDNQENNPTEHRIKQWSWMGSRSPLTSDKEEAEWVLEKLLAKLEDELQRETKLAKKLRAKKEEKQDIPRWPLRRAEDREKALQLPGGGGGDEGDDGTGGSLKTLQGQAGKGETDSRPTSREDKKGLEACFN
jgi:potassium channel subfamily K